MYDLRKFFLSLRKKKWVFYNWIKVYLPVFNHRASPNKEISKRQLSCGRATSS